MGKRSDFPRNTQDHYNTPFINALPLYKHLHGIKSFAEPCYGSGYLHQWLTLFGRECTYRGDIQTGQDALASEEFAAAKFDAIITNPPYRWDILQPMLERFLSLGTAWLLLEMNFASNKRTVGYMQHCSDIVPAGRAKWIEDTKDSSYENYSWFRFSSQHVRGPHLHPVEHINKRKLSALSPQEAFKAHLLR